MEKTTVYIPADLKKRLSECSRSENVSEAEIIRRSLANELVRMQKPRGALFNSGESMSERTEELLAGFGDS